MHVRTRALGADKKSNMQMMQPVVMDMGTGQQASGDVLDKVICFCYSPNDLHHMMPLYQELHACKASIGNDCP